MANGEQPKESNVHKEKVIDINEVKEASGGENRKALNMAF